ncbi:hypothetical protein BAY61_32145 (plasmid) [Prauserella marina]|nr:DUF6247 family protein [Prauserella marina]ASR40009.1 hypothetical protein BAY61_32145 [Prauserella marina]
MTAHHALPAGPPPASSLRPGADPKAISAALLPADQEQFKQEFAQTLERMKGTLDLTELHALLEQWRRLAVLQREPDRFHHVVRRAAELRTGRPVPADEPLETTRADAGI